MRFPTEVVNVRDSPYDLYIGRGRRPAANTILNLGNPFTHLNKSKAGTVINAGQPIDDAMIAVAQYLAACGSSPIFSTDILVQVADVATAIKAHDLFIHIPQRYELLLSDLPYIAGRKLGCYCAPGPCHGDNYVRVIDELGIEPDMHWQQELLKRNTAPVGPVSGPNPVLQQLINARSLFIYGAHNFKHWGTINHFAAQCMNNVQLLIPEHYGAPRMFSFALKKRGVTPTFIAGTANSVVATTDLTHVQQALVQFKPEFALGFATVPAPYTIGTRRYHEVVEQLGIPNDVIVVTI